MRHENLNYTADGLTMQGRFYWDERKSGRRPGVLVFPEGLGISGHTYSFAEKLAGEGYAALACDYFGGGHVSKTGGLDEETGKRLRDLQGNPARTRLRAQAALDALSARPEVETSKIAAIGYCFGGTTALELAFSGAPIVAAVGFHSGLPPVTADDAKRTRAKILVCLGADDPWVPPEQRARFEADLKGTGVQWQIQLYGGVVHSFTNPRSDRLKDPKVARYDEAANQASWMAMLHLFKNVFGA